jgi:hypothetical protein
MANPVPYSRSEPAAASLSLLLTRFLTTAFPTPLETMNPIRLGSSAAMAAAYNTTFRRPLRTPERTVVEKSVAVLRRLRAASTLNSQRDVYRQVSYLGRKLGAALATTGCQDGTAGTGTHTKAEAVLLGSTAVIRLKSPLAHVSYSSGSKVRPPDQYGEELADAKFCICTLPPAVQAQCAWEFRWGQKADTKDFTTLGQFKAPSQTGTALQCYPQLCLSIPNRLWMKWLTEAFREPQPCNYPQPDSQLSSRLLIP